MSCYSQALSDDFPLRHDANIDRASDPIRIVREEARKLTASFSGLPLGQNLVDIGASHNEGHGAVKRLNQDGGREVEASLRNTRPSRCRIVQSLHTLETESRRFGAIYADPPWCYGNRATRAAASKHYPVMSLDQIRAEPVAKLAADPSHLHLWTTNGFLPEAFSVLEAWGFTYKSCFIWVKPQIGTGNYWRVSHEFLLLGVKGKLCFQNHSLRSWVEWPRTVHSRKPDIVRRLIEKASPGPYLEMYGRDELGPAWTVYGNTLS